MSTDTSYLTDPTNISSANILLVGAGGIGCELLKLLITTGFKHISVVDMDKIEKSNLNRQFLFDRSCIGKYKSEMAVQSVHKLRQDSSLDLKAYVGNIKDKKKFPDSFFSQFTLILNALDNIDARYYINRIAMSMKIPLIDSGSEGYFGSVSCYRRGETPCYDCTQKVPDKTIPICSIRLKPEKIEHCIAWGKTLFEKLFSTNSSQNEKEGCLDDYDYLNKKNSVLDILQKLYYDEIVKLKKTAEETDNSEYKLFKGIDVGNIIKEKYSDFEKESAIIYESFSNNTEEWYKAPTKENVKELISIFYHSFNLLVKLTESTPIVFDKENDTIIMFIYSCSNLRALNFLIATSSKFTVKQIAGNIIPAIASTNNIVASIQVIESIKTLYGKKTEIKNVNYLKEKEIRGSTSMNLEINPNCATCSESSLAIANAKELKKTVDFDAYSIEDCLNLLSLFFGKEKYDEMQIDLNKTIIFEKGEHLDEEEVEYYNEFMKKTLSSLNASKGEKEIEMLISYGYAEKEEKQYLRLKLQKKEETNLNGENIINNSLGKKRTRAEDS